jgi:hypothetical protein
MSIEVLALELLGAARDFQATRGQGALLSTHLLAACLLEDSDKALDVLRFLEENGKAKVASLNSEGRPAFWTFEGA